MELQNARAKRFVRPRPALECAQCGDAMHIPEWSEYLEAGRVRHLWRCETCGYAFETTAYFAAA